MRTIFQQKCRVTAINQVGLADLERYQAEMDRRGYAASTRERKTYAIKTFFKFLQHQGITPQAEKHEPRFLSEQEYQQLLRAASHNTHDAAIIELFLQAGIRLSELSRLTPPMWKSPSVLCATNLLKRSANREVIYLYCLSLPCYTEAVNVGNLN